MNVPRRRLFWRASRDRHSISDLPSTSPLSAPSFLSTLSTTAAILFAIAPPAALAPAALWAQSALEPVPSYTQTEAFREEAGLRAVALTPDGNLALAVGEHGTILRSDDGGRSWELRPSPVACALTDVIWINGRHAVAVGGQYDRITGLSRGVALYSDDAGLSWQRGADNELPRLGALSVRTHDGALIATGDWSALAESREFESHDAGRSWASSGELDGIPEVQPETKSSIRMAWADATRTATVIRDVAEHPSGFLVAVGDHGAILRGDRDSGRWSALRGGRHHAAVLVIAKDPASIAWPLVGSETLESHQRVAILLQHPETVGASSEHALRQLQRARQAAAAFAVGALDTIDRSEAVEDEAHHWLRIHRPAVVVLDEALDAATASAFSQTAIAMGVSRVLRYSFAAGGDRTIHRNAMLPFAGALAGDLWSDAIQIVAPEQPIHETVSLRVLYDAAGDSPRGDSLTTGLPLAVGQHFSTPFAKANRRQLQVVQARLSESKRVEQMIQTSATRDFFRRSLQSLLNQTALHDQPRLAWTIQHKLASYDADVFPNATAFLQVALSESAERFADRSFGKWSGLRLKAIQHSQEWKTLNVAVARSLAASQHAPAAVQQTAVSPFQLESHGVAQASAASPLRVAEPTTVQIGAKPTPPSDAEVDLAWEFHPLVLIANEAARQRGDDELLERSGQASGNFRRLLASGSPNPWTSLLSGRDQGKGADGGGSPIVAVPAVVRPKLDGRDDDACWPARPPARTEQPAMRIAYDDQYVYMFVQCLRAPFRHDPPALDPNKNRDHDLTHSDRLQISIDTDQDLMTAYRLQVTPSGKTHDSIDGQAGWQPTWYVAVAKSEQGIDFELAVLRRDLTELPLHRGQNWFVSARIVPAGTTASEPPIPDPALWKLATFR
ncbi:MAG: hypothetical protein ACF788_06080 [Novipirellula sp. JB048]